MTGISTSSVGLPFVITGMAEHPELVGMLQTLWDTTDPRQALLDWLNVTREGTSGDGLKAHPYGESTALMASLEGRVGEPRAKYVHSTEKGLFDLPTVLNNVETWAGIGAIIDQGGEWFASIETRSVSGTPAHGLRHPP